MRTTIEVPDELMTRAKVRAAQEGITLKQLFTSAIEQRLAPGEKKKVRRPPPVIITGGPVRDATREEIAEAMSPIEHIIEEIERSRR
jgi:hypothetical protein